MIREHPILFKAQMVRAILDGRKTQTRRVVKSIGLPCSTEQQWADRIRRQERCPYGQPGDRLWVRETWGPCDGGFCYRADERDGSPAKPDDGRWHPSIHMFRAASRITLDVTGVRVERLQQISGDDAFAEGCTGKLAEEAPAMDDARRDYRDLWDSINGAGAWDANPWVWVVEFRRVP